MIVLLMAKKIKKWKYVAEIKKKNDVLAKFNNSKSNVSDVIKNKYIDVTYTPIKMS